VPGARAGARVPGILAVVQLIQDHREAAARTLRERFGIGLSDLGDRVTWGEAKTLLEAAVEDGSTWLGADLGGWAYPASMPELLSIAAAIGDWKAAKKVMPWAMESPRRQSASAEEVEAAQAELEAGIVFA
jgi:hypothetical protein